MKIAAALSALAFAQGALVSVAGRRDVGEQFDRPPSVPFSPLPSTANAVVLTESPELAIRVRSLAGLWRIEKVYSLVIPGLVCVVQNAYYFQ